MSSLWSEFDFCLGPDVPQRNDIALKCDHIPLKYLGLSTRTLNALLRCNIKVTVGELVRAKRGFVEVENVGTAAFKELDAKISCLLTANTKDGNTLFPSLSDKLSVLLNSQDFFPSPVKAFPENIQQLPIDHLHLEKKDHDALISTRITTIGELDSADSSTIRSVRFLSVDSLENINHALIMLHNSLTRENEIDWFFYWECQGIQLILPTYSSTSSPEEVFKDLSLIIEEVLRREINEKAGIIIKHRFGLGNEARCTLEDIGNALGGISRERVRQIEEQSLTVLQAIFVKQEYGGRIYQIYPSVHSIVETIQERIANLPNKLTLETQLQRNLSQKLHIDVEKYKAQLALILLLIGVRRREFNYPNAVPVWGYIEPNLLLRLEKWLKRLDELLTQETSHPLSELKILAHLNKKVKKPDALQPSLLDEVIDLCSTVERLEGGAVCGKFEYLKGRGNQVERLLTKAGHPMDAADLAREINHRLVPLGHRQLTEANLINQILNDDRFVSIGRSGQWGLKSWDIDTNSILKLMEQYLIIHNKPASIDEIYSYISERRPVNRRSIITYLGIEKELFVKVDLTHWGLVKWSKTINPGGWTPEKMADFVAAIFKEKNTKELDYRIIKDALVKETGLTEQQVRGLLIHNPVIKTQKGKKWGERIALFQSNYKNALAQAKKNKPHREKGALQNVEKSVHTILNAAPNKEMLMNDLIVELQKRFSYSESTLYQYVLQIRSIERIGIPNPNSQKKICRVKEVIENDSSYRHSPRESR